MNMYVYIYIYIYTYTYIYTYIYICICTHTYHFNPAGRECDGVFAKRTAPRARQQAPPRAHYHDHDSHGSARPNTQRHSACIAAGRWGLVVSRAWTSHSIQIALDARTWNVWERILMRTKWVSNECAARGHLVRCFSEPQHPGISARHHLHTV